MGQAAMSMGESAVKEGQRCFSAPLDHTVQNVKAPAMPGRAKMPEPFYSLELGSGNDHAGITTIHNASTSSHGKPPVGAMGGQATIPYGGGCQRDMSHLEDSPGYFEAPLSQSELGCFESHHGMEDTSSNLMRLDGSDSPPPEPPRPNPITNATMRAPEPPRSISNATAQAPMPQAPSPVPVATSPSVAPVNPAARMAAHKENDEQQRAMWRQGSILEIYSASAGYWYPALVLRVQRGEGTPDVLTMQFWLNTDDAKQKSLYRNDCQQLAPLGANLDGELPPGFILKPSQSRPGHSVYLDQTTGMKYQTAELAWQTHFQRLLERPAAAGCETVCHLPAPGQSSFQMNKQGHPQSAAAGLVTEHGADTGSGMPSPPNPKQAAMVAEGLVTEHGPAMRGQCHPGPRTPQAQRQVGGHLAQQFQANSPAATEQRQQQHGSQLAAELSGWRPQGGAGQQPVHQHTQQHPALPQNISVR